MDEKNERSHRLSSLKRKLKYTDKQKELSSLEKEASSEGVWNNWEKGQSISRKIASLKKELEEVDLLELYMEAGESEEVEFESLIKKLELKTYLSGSHDQNNALLSIHAGQGGTEACDWAQILSRMYLRYSENKGFKVEEVDKTNGDEAGIKSVTYEIQGEYAYGLLKNEGGVHRLVRLSPFNANNLRQTSFALVEVMPELEDDTEIEIKPEEIEFEAYHSSGHGGQNVNKVSTAVRIRHKPTGIVVACQTERFQGRNREIAMKVLRGKLFALKQEELVAQKKSIKGEHKAPGWGNQIRNYVLHPYKLVKDVRTDFESTNPDHVLDGNIDDFIEAKLRQ